MKFPVKWSGVLLVALSGCLTATASAGTSFDFSRPPELQSGVELTQGAVYRFSEGAESIDVLVGIADSVNAI